MKVLVIGGTRFIGPAAVAGLVERGAEVTVLHRGDTEYDFGSDVEHAHADRSTVAEEAERRRPDVLLDMVPIHAGHGDDLVAAAYAGDIGRVVAVASMDVYRAFDVVHGKDDVIQETPFDEMADVRNVRFPYADQFESDHPMAAYDKLDVEDRVLHDDAFTGISLRLPAVFGEGDFQHRVGQYLFQMVDGAEAIELSDAAENWRFMRSYRNDVGDAIALACVHPDATGIYNVGTTDRTEREWLQTIADVHGWQGEIRIVPDDDLPEDSRMGAAARQDLVGDTTKIRSELGWTETIGIEDGIARTIPWELDNRPS